MRLLTIPALLLLAALQAVLAPHAQCRVIHVPGDASTIQAGINAASYGDTVLVAPGTYRERVFPKNGVALLGSGADRTAIWPLNSHPVVLQGDFGPDTRIESFLLIGHTANPWDSGIWCEFDCSPCIRFNVIIGAVNGVLLKENWGFPLIEHNTIYANSGCGILSYTGSEPYAQGIPTIRNNVIAANGTGVSRSLDAPPLEPSLDYNDVWGNSTNYNHCSPGGHSVCADPLFCNAAFHNFYVDAVSPVIGTGEFGSDMGALGAGCGASAVEPVSWSQIKAMWR